jgi:hypothetical protein
MENEQVEVTEKQEEPSRVELLTKAFEDVVEKPEVTLEKPEGRDEKGRFAAAAPKPEPGTSLPSTDAPLEAAAPKKPLPKSWKQDYAPKWEKLVEVDGELADFLAQQEDRREQDVLKGIEKYKNDAAYGSQIRQSLQPREQMLVQQYGGIQQGLDHLFKLSDFASQRPQEFIQWFAQQRGIALPGFQPQATDPYVNELRQTVEQLQQKLSGLEQKATYSPYLSEVEKFASDPKHEHFEELRPFMAALIESGSAPDLDTAYEQAMWSRPDLREKQLAAQRQEWAAEQEKVRQQKIAASSSVKGSPPSGSDAKPNIRDRRSVIENALNHHVR